MAQDRVPSAKVLDDARSDAEAAAGVDDRWGPLLVRVRVAQASRAEPGFGAAVDALAAECGRVNEIVRRGGKEPAGA